MKKFLCYDTEQAARGEINVDSRGMLKSMDSELSDTSTNPVQNKVIKSALDSLSEEIVNLPQPDWNQNDDAQPDYVKNRPFYEGDPTVLLEESTLPFADNAGLYMAPLSINSEITEDIFKGFWKISWDGTVYNCTPVNFSGVLLAGNLSIIRKGSDTGEPFIIFINTGDDEVSFISTLDTSDSHTLSISHVPVVQIDEIYLPSTIPYMQSGKIPVEYLPEKFPDARDVFGGVLHINITYSTLANPYPNKTILHDLTVEAFNVLLNDLSKGTMYVMVDGNVALVSGIASDNTILVSWSDSSLYVMPDKPIAGAHTVVYKAKIHEDTDNPGAMISECAAVLLADKKVT